MNHDRIGSVYLPSRRASFMAGAVVSIALVVFGVAYLQEHLGVEPCPLCVFQRIFFVAFAIALLVAAIHNPGRVGSRLYGLVFLILAGVGAAIAGRQVYLQHLPPNLRPSCGPDLQYLLANSPLWDALRQVIRGTGDCAVVEWTFLNLSIAEWSLVSFIGLGLLMTVRAFIIGRRDPSQAARDSGS